MGDSIQKACSFITSLALGVIAVQLIPFSRDKELSNHCREYLAIINVLPGSENEEQEIRKRAIIASKIEVNNNFKKISYYCNSFYLNQK